MKKAITIIVLLTMLVEVTGYKLFFSFWHWQVKRSVKQSLRNPRNHRNAEYLVFEEQEWLGLEKHKDEFSYRNSMYDVLEMKRENGKVIVKCINDKKENELIARTKAFNSDFFAKGGKKKAVQLLNAISAPFLLPETISIPPYFVHINTFFFNDCWEPGPTLDIPTPPPLFG
ncbi:hypothetical protein KJS94_14935 [Flavihumibacter rivuli]|uniref:hypothetical protein n=1 Tax=Flavihumibacter rivuli TaxID=2838156 RepID=UPI001BDDF595|nr:hypothetical protein [Flavihumibacter rivuli]ULQ55943.1 hypothetical protein KJS94_14935 [Flavihumibacter rivuli]